MRNFTSRKAAQFNESVIREMTRQAMRHGAVNLAQGFPDFSAPEEIKRAAQQAIDADMNQYAITWGAKNLREAIARHALQYQGIEIDPETEITVCCGSTEAMIASLLAIVDAGDEVVIFEPYYENYGPDVILSDATPRFVKLRPPESDGGRVDVRREGVACGVQREDKGGDRQHAEQSDGKVFTREELEFIRDLCVEFDALAITDEIYEHILYDGARTHLDRNGGWYARPDDHHQRDVEDIQCDGVARRMGDCAGIADECDSQGA